MGTLYLLSEVQSESHGSPLLLFIVAAAFTGLCHGQSLFSKSYFKYALGTFLDHLFIYRCNKFEFYNDSNKRFDFDVQGGEVILTANIDCSNFNLMSWDRGVFFKRGWYRISGLPYVPVPYRKNAYFSKSW